MQSRQPGNTLRACRARCARGACRTDRTGGASQPLRTLITRGALFALKTLRTCGAVSTRRSYWSLRTHRTVRACSTGLTRVTRDALRRSALYIRGLP